MGSATGVANRVMITGGLMLATLMNTLDTTILNVALPHIQGSVSAAQDQITWVLTSYIVATAIMTPLSGWLALKVGRKPMFLASIAGFVAASVLCGIATSLPEIVVFRLLQGVAGASMMPLSQAAMLDIWPQRLVPRVMSVWSAVVMVGPVLGPTLGGWLTEHYSWRWVFYINVPVGAVAFAAVFLFMGRADAGQQRPFDFLGFGALVLFTGAFQLMVDRGPGVDWFDSAEVRIYAVVAAVAFYVFLMQTLTVDQPFFHRDLVRDRNFVSCTIFGFFLAVVLFSSSALLPTFMQNLLGYSALQSGLASMPRGVGSLVAFTVVPWLAIRFGPRIVIAAGLALSVAALWRMGHFDLAMTATPIQVTGLIQGLGMGLMFNPLSVLSYATLAPRHRTEAAVVSSMARTLGGSLGIALLQALLIRQSATAHERLAAHVIPTDPVVRWMLPPFFDPASASGAAALNAEITRQGLMIGYDAVFGWMAVISLLMLPLLAIMRPTKPSTAELLEAHVE